VLPDYRNYYPLLSLAHEQINSANRTSWPAESQAGQALDLNESSFSGRCTG
jgi:hypothetical protein